jgi:hypothetical protein
MLDLNPEFHIYGPPPFIFGGVEIRPPYTSSDIINDMPKVIKSIGDHIYTAYEIYMRTETVTKNLISTKLSPLIASIDNKCIEYQITNRKLDKENEKLAKISILRLSVHKLHTGFFARDDGFYVAHILKEKFDPETTEFLIKQLKTAILKLTYDKFRVTSSISDNLLRVDAELIPSDSLYVV